MHIEYLTNEVRAARHQQDANFRGAVPLFEQEAFDESQVEAVQVQPHQWNQIYDCFLLFFLAKLVSVHPLCTCFRFLSLLHMNMRC